MSTDPVGDDINDAIVNEVLQRAFPQGARLLEKERGLAILRYGAQRLLASPLLAVEVLGTDAEQLGQAMITASQRLAVDGARTVELAKEVTDGESEPVMPRLRSYNTETDQ